MPPETGVSTTSRPAHRFVFGPSHTLRDHRGAFLLTFITFVIIAAAIVNSLGFTPSESVTVLLRDTSGGRALYKYVLADRTLQLHAEAAPEASMGERTIPLRDGSVIGLQAPGIVRITNGDLATMEVLVASPVAPFVNTPFAVWGEGQRLAWKSPADDSLQVYERTERGAYQPVFLLSDVRANSLGFTASGAYLVVGSIEGEATRFFTLRLSDGSILEGATIPGFASIISTP